MTRTAEHSTLVEGADRKCAVTASARYAPSAAAPDSVRVTQNSSSIDLNKEPPSGARKCRSALSCRARLRTCEPLSMHFIRKAVGRQGILRAGPEIVICVPSGSTQVERRAIRDAASNAGARKVWLIDEPMAAAIGADLPVTHPIGSMVVDIRGGTTEVGVISTGGMNESMSARVGGDSMDEAIALHVRRNYNLLIGEATAERVKKELGAALIDPSGPRLTAVVKGRDIGQGVPAEVCISQAEISEALAECVAQVLQVVRSTLESTAPEIAADLIEGGIIMTGGGSLLHGIDVVLARATGLPVRIADDPLNCVAIGAGRTLEDPAYHGVLHGT